MRFDRETRTAYLVMAACELVRLALQLLPLDASPWASTALPRFVCHACFLITWMRLMRSRFIRREVQRCFTAIALLLLAWLAAQHVRYEFTDGLFVLATQLWYAYYVPIAFVPPLLFMAVQYVGRDVTWHADVRWNLLYLGAAALSALALTNGMHQLVFRLVPAPGLAINYAAPERHAVGPVLCLIWAWAALLGLGALVVLVRRCVRSGPWVRVLAPLGVVALMGAILPPYGVPSAERLMSSFFMFPDVVRILLVAFMESLFVVGLFPANSGYGALWRASSLAGGLVDESGTPAYVSANATTLAPEQLAAAADVPLSICDGRSELVVRPVTGGRVFWVRNLSHVWDLRASLGELGDALEQEQSLLEAENALAHSREALARRQEVYDRMIANTSRHLRNLEAVLAEMPASEEGFLHEMRHGALLATYIKRCANLTLLDEGGTVDARELRLAFGETANALRACGLEVDVALDVEGPLPADAALDAYATFERRFEERLEARELAPALVTVRMKDGALELVDTLRPAQPGACAEPQEGGSA